MTRRTLVCFLLLLLSVAGCRPSAPEDALQQAVEHLHQAIEAKDSGAVLDLLHENFRAQQNFDRQWAKQTMLMLFLRHKHVKVLVLQQQSLLDTSYHDRARTQATVALVGAEGLIPDSARHYQLTLNWQLHNQQWQLAELHWE